MELNQIICGDALSILKSFPDESINCCVTSPPYYALRDYNIEGQIGLENTFNDYLDRLWAVFNEVKRVLKSSGACWVNLGDCYATPTDFSRADRDDLHFMQTKRDKMTGIPTKCLVQIPSRFAIGMTDRGWILRNELIWNKPNCMPSSANDRFTIDFEKVFFFVKNKKYYFEQQFEPHLSGDENSERIFYPGSKGYETLMARQVGKGKRTEGEGEPIILKYGKYGRNKRTVWQISTKPSKDVHFAKYPEKLIETPIKATCPEYICVKCGKIKEKFYEEEIRIESCNCNAEFSSGIVLDPFIGSGTTAIVSKKLNRNYIGIELNPEYIEIANKKILESFPKEIQFNKTFF